MGDRNIETYNEFTSGSIAVNNTREGPETEETLVYRVVSAVAEVMDADPLEMPPLNEAIDPDALNALFTSRSGSAISQVSFEYAGYEILVRRNEEVEVHVQTV